MYKHYFLLRATFTQPYLSYTVSVDLHTIQKCFLYNIHHQTSTFSSSDIFSTKRKCKTRIQIAKISKQERRDILKSLLSDLPLYSSETSLARASETTEAQTSKSCHVNVYAYIIYTSYTIIMYSYTCTCTYRNT